MDFEELQQMARNGAFTNRRPYSASDRKTREAYERENTKIYQRFKMLFNEAMLTEIGIKKATDITIASKTQNIAIDGMLSEAFAFCWDQGHGSGYNEVVTYGSDMAPILKAAVEAGKMLQ